MTKLMSEIRVRFKDGSAVEENKATETFIAAIRKIGVEKVHALGIESMKHPLVTEERVMEKDAKFMQSPVDGYWVTHGQNVKGLCDILRKISSRLGLDLKVDEIG